MGRHSDPDPRWFWLSLGAAAGKALLAVLLLGAVAVGVTRLAGGGAAGDAEPDVPEPSAGLTAVADEPAADASEDAFETEPAGSGSESEPGSGEPGTETESADPDEDEDTEDEDEDGGDEDGGDDAPVRATVQVLDGGGDASAVREAIAALEARGYQVVAQSRAARTYPRTTVFWSEGFEDEAEELREEDERFAVLQENDRLDATINLHVVIGRDWEPSR